jgi:hypothetical protein
MEEPGTHRLRPDARSPEHRRRPAVAARIAARLEAGARPPDGRSPGAPPLARRRSTQRCSPRGRSQTAGRPEPRSTAAGPPPQHAALLAWRPEPDRRTAGASEHRRRPAAAARSAARLEVGARPPDGRSLEAQSTAATMAELPKCTV